MKAIVCVKQVPDTSGKVSVKPDGTLDRASMATITNPDDLNALEAALKLKDATGCEVVVVTMGPPPAEGMLRELLARGADKAVLVSGREFGGSDTFATSQILAAAVNKIGVGPEDVVFCGRQAIDGDTAQVGPQIAEKLHLPQVTYAADIKKDGDTLTIQAQRHSEHEEQEKKGKYVCCERSYGAYSRSFDVSGIRAEGITASYDSGVLTLKLPKKTVEVSSSRQISID